MLHELSNNVDLFFVECQSAEDVMSYYDSSLAVRNLKKEVGHYFFKVKIEQKEGNKLKFSSITFVDLAPSDCMLK